MHFDVYGIWSPMYSWNVSLNKQISDLDVNLDDIYQFAKLTWN